MSEQRSLIIKSTTNSVYRLGKTSMWECDSKYCGDGYSASRKQIALAMRPRLRLQDIGSVYRRIRYRRMGRSFKTGVWRGYNSIEIGCQHFDGRDYLVLRKWALSQ